MRPCGTLARHRNNVVIRWLSRKCARFLDCYENAANYDFMSNGEHFVLSRLARQDFRVVFDVGANRGDWAKLAHPLFPNASIHCFEILEPTYEILSRSTRDLPRIKTNPFGLLDRTGEISVNTFSGADALTTVTDYPHGLERRIATARVVTGDDYVEANGIATIDLLKLDVEGAEGPALKGLEKTIAAGRVSVIQFEYGEVSILTKFLLKDFYDFLARYGYRIGKIYPNQVEFRQYHFAQEDFRGSNYLAIREDLHSLFDDLA